LNTVAASTSIAAAHWLEIDTSKLRNPASNDFTIWQNTTSSHDAKVFKCE
jgi:hypothetical protein